MKYATKIFLTVILFPQILLGKFQNPFRYRQAATPLMGNDLAACRFSEVNFSPPLGDRRPFSSPPPFYPCAKRRRSLMSRSCQPFTYRIVTPVIGLFSLMNCLLICGFEWICFRSNYIYEEKSPVICITSAIFVDVILIIEEHLSQNSRKS